MEENQREVEDIREEVESVNKLERELKDLIPESIHVSYFNIQCNELLTHLLDKYQTLSKELIKLIAKRCKESTQRLFNSFEVIKGKIKEQPKGIEQLTELKEYMSNLPSNLIINIFLLYNSLKKKR